MLWRHFSAEEPWVREWSRIPSDTCGRANTIWIRYVWTEKFLNPERKSCGFENIRIRADRALGTLRKIRRQRPRERHQTKGLMSKTMALNVRFNSWHISLPFSAKHQREMTKFCVVWRTWPTSANFWVIFLQKKYLLVDASTALSLLWVYGWVSQSVSPWEMYVFYTNQIGSTIDSQSNFFL